jgi:hypothetical protein
MLHATSQTRRVIDLLKVSGSIKREILAWAAAQARGVHRPLSKAARKRGVRIAYRNGKLTLRVPAASIAPTTTSNPVSAPDDTSMYRYKEAGKHLTPELLPTERRTELEALEKF